MRLLAQEEYGLRCLLQVARRQSPEPVSILSIAEAEGLSPEYAGKLMQELRRAGLVTSAKGARGGYRLARAPEAISVWDGIEALGGALFPADFCACHPGQREACVHTGDCSLRALWRAVDASVRGFLERVSLADLARGERSLAVWIEDESPLLGGDECRSSH